MSNIICVTNRKLCKDNFFDRIEEIAKSNTNAIVLREKDLSQDEYYNLSIKVIAICNKYNTTCILHNYPDVAKKLNCKNIHLPLNVLEKLSDKEKDYFNILGASCHSVDDAIKAQKLGCTYIFAGHIYDTDCKKGLKGRGLNFLSDVCKSVEIPVYAIGGMCKDNYKSVIDNGGSGSAVMSGLMVCKSPTEYINDFEE